MAADSHTQVAQLYVALFGRAPDSGGLAYWSNLLQTGQSAAQVADAMFGTAPARAYFPDGLSHQQIVASFYQHVLGRTADDTGLAFWTAKMDQPGATAGSVIAEMIATVDGYAGWNAAGLLSATLFNQRVAAAKAFAESSGSLQDAGTFFSPTHPAGPTLVVPGTASGQVNARGYVNAEVGLVAGDISFGINQLSHLTLTASPQVAPVYKPGDLFADYNDVGLLANGAYPVFTLSLVSAGDINARMDLLVSGVLHIESLDTDATAHLNKLDLDGAGIGNGLRFITVTGNAGLSFGNDAAGHSLRFVDASAATGDIRFSSLAPDAIAVIGGSGSDVLDASGAKEATLFGGAGNDTLIAPGDNPSILVGGAGGDTFKVGFNDRAQVAATIVDFNLAEGDQLAQAINGPLVWHAAQVKLGTTATYAAYLDAAASYVASTATPHASWFQFGGDTYVVYDFSPATSFSSDNSFHVDPSGKPYYAHADAVVKLVGLVDLGAATQTATGVIGLASLHPAP